MSLGRGAVDLPRVRGTAMHRPFAAAGSQPACICGIGWVEARRWKVRERGEDETAFDGAVGCGYGARVAGV